MKKAVTILVYLLFTPTVVFSQHNVGEYTKEVVLSIPWGNAPGEIGLIPEIRGSSSGGPSSFALDDESNIYLLDGGNMRIQVFNSMGYLINYFRLPDGNYEKSSIVFEDTSDEIFVSLYDHFLVYDTAGKLIKTIQCKDNKSWDFYIDNGMIFSGIGVMILEEAKKLDALGMNGEDVYTIASHRDEILMQKHPRNKYIRVRTSENIINFIVGNSENIDEALEFDMVPEGYSISFMRDTIYKESIFFAAPMKDKELPEMLLKFNYEGDLVSLISDHDMLVINGYYFKDYIVVTDEGFVYTASLNSEGLIITKWN